MTASRGSVYARNRLPVLRGHLCPIPSRRHDYAVRSPKPMLLEYWRIYASCRIRYAARSRYHHIYAARREGICYLSTISKIARSDFCAWKTPKTVALAQPRSAGAYLRSISFDFRTLLYTSSQFRGRRKVSPAHLRSSINADCVPAVLQPSDCVDLHSRYHGADTTRACLQFTFFDTSPRNYVPILAYFSAEHLVSEGVISRVWRKNARLDMGSDDELVIVISPEQFPTAN